jgi:hypothetical protein
MSALRRVPPSPEVIFYDPNYDEDGMEWDGSGVWDLMAGGS